MYRIKYIVIIISFFTVLIVRISYLKSFNNIRSGYNGKERYDKWLTENKELENAFYSIANENNWRCISRIIPKRENDFLGEINYKRNDLINLYSIKPNTAIPYINRLSENSIVLFEEEFNTKNKAKQRIASNIVFLEDQKDAIRIPVSNQQAYFSQSKSVLKIGDALVFPENDEVVRYGLIEKRKEVIAKKDPNSDLVSLYEKDGILYFILRYTSLVEKKELVAICYQKPYKRLFIKADVENMSIVNENILLQKGNDILVYFPQDRHTELLTSGLFICQAKNNEFLYFINRNGVNTGDLCLYNINTRENKIIVRDFEYIRTSQYGTIPFCSPDGALFFALEFIQPPRKPMDLNFAWNVYDIKTGKKVAALYQPGICKDNINYEVIALFINSLLCGFYKLL